MHTSFLASFLWCSYFSKLKRQVFSWHQHKNPRRFLYDSGTSPHKILPLLYLETNSGSMPQYDLVQIPSSSCGPWTLLLAVLNTVKLFTREIHLREHAHHEDVQIKETYAGMWMILTPCIIRKYSLSKKQISADNKAQFERKAEIGVQCISWTWLSLGLFIFKWWKPMCEFICSLWIHILSFRCLLVVSDMSHPIWAPWDSPSLSALPWAGVRGGNLGPLPV